MAQYYQARQGQYVQYVGRASLERIYQLHNPKAQDTLSQKIHPRNQRIGLLR
jgi:hypothetical protein